ncbi:MAG: beta galactosidase jelly roll domain-containing protein [Oscillospiraceae bacterium]|nr:beta galactosidase jelly roll domain-containing protein [Oscillospiraceae bacterium]
MKKRPRIICSILVTAQLMLNAAVAIPVHADDKAVSYDVPQSQHETYNMNLDWHFFDTEIGADKNVTMQQAMDKAKDSTGKQFWEAGYDESKASKAWETVSIPHAVSAHSSFSSYIVDAGGSDKRGVFLYRKTFTVPAGAENGKVFFELEGIRQAAYVWVNGQPIGYYEAGITAMGFDITDAVEPGKEAVIAILNDGTSTRGTTGRVVWETVPGQPWGSSQSNGDGSAGSNGGGSAYQWNTKDFNEVQAGLVYDAYLHITGEVYQTLPLYNNLKTTGNYIYADNFNVRGKTATIHVDAEIRNESNVDGNYKLEVAIVDHEGNLLDSFEGSTASVPAAKDTGVVYQTAVENDVYDAANIENAVGLTKVNTVDVTHIEASKNVSDLRFWSTDDPYLYTVYTILKDSSGNVVDVQKKETGFRKVTYDRNSGILINDKPVWLTGYAQRATNEWAAIGVAPDWLQDWDMSLMRDGNNANFIRWMHVAPKPAEVRSSDKYGVAIAAPAGDKEGTAPNGRQWSQRTEAMRDTMIYFRNSPSVIFWETGNSPVGTEAKANEMAALRNEIDPHGMRFIGARSTTAANELNYEYNYAGTMCAGPDPGTSAIAAMSENGKYGPIMETEYSRDEAPRRVWDDYSPPDYDYVNKYLGEGASKEDKYDVWDHTQESITVANLKDYANNFYANRAGQGKNYYSAAAMMVWTDSDMHGRNSGSENARTSGRVDAIRQTKEMYEGTRVAQSSKPAVHIVGHWSYPEYTSSSDTYYYFDKTYTGITDKDKQTYWVYDNNKKLRRNPTAKTVYVIGSADVKKVELYRVDKGVETLIGTDDTPDSTFIYEFVADVTQGDGVIAKAYNARGALIAEDEIARTGDAKGLKLEVTTSDDGWRADGSDIAFVDVKVVDANGNVCALNYDKIDFEYSGSGVYMGGYNSGMGEGCFQNMPESAGLSNYFGGAKDGVSTIGKDYVYAENGTNRIFVKSTRDAGTFTLTAKMAGGIEATTTITSTPVATTGGLTTLMQSKQERDPGEPPVEIEVDAMYPLQLTARIINWANIDQVEEIDTNVYYTVNVNGTPIELEGKSRARLGTMNLVFGPVVPILEAVEKQYNVDLGYTYNGNALPQTLSFTGSNGEPYVVTVADNFIVNQNTGERTEIVQEPQMIDGKMFVSLSAVLSYLGIKVEQDNTNHVVNITYQAQ